MENFNLTPTEQEYILSLGTHWMVRTDKNGMAHNGFAWQPIGQWTVADDWDPEPICGGGLHGQGPGGYDYAQDGDRFLFCETGEERVAIEYKIKCRKARILFEGGKAFAALRFVTQDNFPGSIYVSGCDLAGVTLPKTVGGSLDVSGCDLAGVTLPKTVGGSLDVSGCDLAGVTLPKTVGGSIDLRGCNIKGVTLPKTVGCALNVSGCDLAGITFPQTVGGALYVSGCDLAGVTLPKTVGGWLNVSGCDLAGVTLPPGVKVIK